MKVPGHLRTMNVSLPSELNCRSMFALHHAHRRHHDDDGKHADQHAEQRQCRAQLVRRNRAKGHARSFRAPR